MEQKFATTLEAELYEAVLAVAARTRSLTTYPSEVMRQLRAGKLTLRDSHYTGDGIAAYALGPDGREYCVSVTLGSPPDHCRSQQEEHHAS